MEKGSSPTPDTDLAPSAEPFIEINRLPGMAGIFFKAFLVAPFRSNRLEQLPRYEKHRILLKQMHIKKDQLETYCSVCGFDTWDGQSLPLPFLQTLFTGILGKYITSAFFPFNPFGLVHVFQSLEQKRKIHFDEKPDLSCTLEHIRKTQKGFESVFRLEVFSQSTLVWQGVSVFLSRGGSIKKPGPVKRKEPAVERFETLWVPGNIGRQYASVSGDFNPHHLNGILAKIFGFKGAIAHGMWSLAAVTARLGRQFNITEQALVEAHFKLPIFMPAATNLGFVPLPDNFSDKTAVRFELWDEHKKKPHLKGTLYLPD